MILRAVLLWLAFATAALAVEPDEILGDPAMEARARVISKELRCLVCRNESIDESNAELARDLRILLRERISAGDSDAEAVAFIVDRYGEYVLLNPRSTGANLILWIAGPVLFLAALGLAGFYIAGRTKAEPGALSEAEKERLARLLDE